MSDHSGKIVFKTSIAVFKQQNTYEIKLPNLSTGSYWVSLSNGGEYVCAI